MAKKTTFHQKSSGSYAEDDDEFTLVEANDGSQTIEHSWEHVDVRHGGNADRGTKTYSVADFMKGDAALGVKEKLRKLLGLKDA